MTVAHSKLVRLERAAVVERVLLAV